MSESDNNSKEFGSDAQSQCGGESAPLEAEAGGDSHDCDGRGTIFTTKMVWFPAVLDEHIETEPFLDASKGVILLVEMFGKVFSAVRYDLEGNILKLENQYKENPEMYKFIEDMVLDERQNGGALVTDALQWLRRGLHFLLRFLDLVMREEDDKSMSLIMKVAYDDTLAPYHGWMGSQLFNILCRFAPTRASFYHILSLQKPDKYDQVQNDMGEYLVNLQLCIDHLVHFYQTNDLEHTSPI